MKRKKSRVGVAILIILALAVLGGALFIIFTNKQLSLPFELFTPKDATETAAPVTFAGDIKLFTLTGGAAPTSGEADIDVQKAALEQVVSFAADNGFNAIMYEGGRGEGELYYRKGEGTAAKSLTQYDKPLNKWDPLKHLCATALAKGVGVMVYFAPENITVERAKALSRAYSIAGVYCYNAGTGAFGSYDGVDGENDIAALCDASTFMGAAELVASEGFTGLVLGEYTDILASPAHASMYAALFNNATPPTPLSLAPKKELGLAYPLDTTARLYTSTCFIMGTSSPELPLTINGKEVVRTGTDGTFGVLVDLEYGENSFTLAQSANELHFVLTRAKRTGGGGGTVGADSTVELGAGRMVEVSTGIASALSDPSSDDNINETVKQGARATVTGSVRTMRSGKKTWAYQLASGDYLLARNVKVLDSVKRAAFTSATVEKHDNGETIRFVGEGTPLAYTLREDNVLTLTFYDADFAEGFNITGSDFISGMSKTIENGCTVIKLQLSAQAELWGWDIQYKDGTTQLYFKKAPRQSSVFARPLEGVRVLLDAGHGDKDSGAMGVGGLSSAQEKDVNLAVALSAKYYLEQLGATVLTTRADDTFRTLDERLMMINDEAPDFFISVHHNSVELTVDANTSTGTECYYFYKWHQPLANSLSALVSEAGARKNRDPRYGYYYVTRTTMAPSVLLEVGFMVNPFEYEQLTNAAVIQREGAAIAKSILDNVK